MFCETSSEQSRLCEIHGVVGVAEAVVTSGGIDDGALATECGWSLDNVTPVVIGRRKHRP